MRGEAMADPIVSKALASGENASQVSFRLADDTDCASITGYDELVKKVAMPNAVSLTDGLLRACQNSGSE